MFTNRESGIIYEKIVRNRSPAYVPHRIGKFYAEQTYSQENGKDRGSADTFLVVIPEKNSEYFPKKDDRIVLEDTPDETPPDSALTVISVKDRRYGSQIVRHIEVIAE